MIFAIELQRQLPAGDVSPGTVERGCVLSALTLAEDKVAVGGICAEGAASYTRKQLDALTEFVKRPQIGAKGMVYARVEGYMVFRLCIEVRP